MQLATFNNPLGLALSEIIYVADYQSVRVIQGNVVTTLAGPTDASSGGQCPTGFVDGTGTAARFNYITAIVRDPHTGNLFVTEHSNNAVRMITAAGVVTTLAGQGPMSGPGTTASIDGIGTAATFNHPSGITIDPSGTYLYVSDSYDYSIRRITIATANVETMIKGQYLPNAGPTLSNPTGIWYAPGTPDQLYIVDQGWSRIRTIDPALFTGTALPHSALAILPSTAPFLFNQQPGIIVDAGSTIYLTEGNGESTTTNQVRMGALSGGHPVVAGGTGAGDAVSSTGATARFNTPAGIALGSGGMLFIADSRNNRVARMGTASPFPVSVRAGSETGHPLGCRDGGV